MVKKNYQVELGDKRKTARAIITNAQVSLKYATTICNKIKGQLVNKSIASMQRIEAHEEYLPLTRYNKKIGHKKGNALGTTKSGRYPERTVAKFIELLKLVKNNAEAKGLDSEKLSVLNAFASMGMSRYNSQPKGKIGGKMRRHKSTHLEIIVTEVKA